MNLRDDVISCIVPRTMNKAVIETGGKQYLVAVGDTIKTEIISGKNTGDAVSFDRVLLLDDDKNTTVGTPHISGATVEGKIVEEGRNKKIFILRSKPKSRWRRRQGHRQHYIRVMIEKINAA